MFRYTLPPEELEELRKEVEMADASPHIIRVGVRRFREKLADFLEKVHHGNEDDREIIIVITKYGKPFATLRKKKDDSIAQ